MYGQTCPHHADRFVHILTIQKSALRHGVQQVPCHCSA